MNAGPTSVRMYDAIRLRLRQRRYRPGTRIDPAAFADELGSSPTPVRDALHILAGEGFITAGPSGGFTTPVVDEPGLIDLYRWTEDILQLSLKKVRQQPSHSNSVRAGTHSENLIERTEALFLRIAERSGNIEHGRALVHANARLFGPRLAEAKLVPDAEDELAAIADCVERWDGNGQRRLLQRYTKRREGIAAMIVRQMYREDD